MPISGGYYYPGINGTYQALRVASIIAPNSHLILSSSAGGVVDISGAIKIGQYAQADLPTGDTYSGSIVWVSDKKCLAVYTSQRMA